MPDLHRDLFTNFDYLLGLEELPLTECTLLEGILERLLGFVPEVTRITSHLQGPLEFLEASAELRLHLWFRLPEGHERFPEADRGMIALVHAVEPQGLEGPATSEVAWLGAPLGEHAADDEPGDWVAEMERDQGYRDLPGSSWSAPLQGWPAAQLLSWVLVRHLAEAAPRASLVLAGSGMELAAGAFEE